MQGRTKNALITLISFVVLFIISIIIVSVTDDTKNASGTYSPLLTVASFAFIISLIGAIISTVIFIVFNVKDGQEKRRIDQQEREIENQRKLNEIEFEKQKRLNELEIQKLKQLHVMDKKNDID